MTSRILVFFGGLLWSASLATSCGPDSHVLGLVGGENITDFYPYSYMAQLMTYDHDKKGDHIRGTCGAVVLSEWYVLTSAHCYYYYGDDKPAQQSSIIFGTPYDMFSKKYNPVQRSSEKVILHPEYVRRGLKNDLAIVRLSSPIKMSDGGADGHPISAIQMANSDEEPEGETCVTLGWGGDGVNPPTVLQKLALPVLDDDSCRRDRKSYDPKKSICAGRIDGKTAIGTCKGDSGGPLVCRPKNKLKQCKLFGVLSMRKGSCTAKIDPHLMRPSHFSRVPYYRKWIDSVLDD